MNNYKATFEGIWAGRFTVRHDNVQANNKVDAIDKVKQKHP